MLIREARPEDAGGIARVHVDSWRSTYRGMVPDNLLDNLNYESRQEWWAATLRDPAQTGFVYVAEDDTGEIAGFTMGGPTRTDDPDYLGELYAIYLLAQCQGQGVGRQLVRAVTRRLAEAGMISMLVWVLAENPARDFYQALGGTYIREQQVSIGGAELRELAYGWRDTARLLD